MLIEEVRKGEVHLYRCEVTVDVAPYTEYLTKAELMKAEGFRRSLDRIQYINGRGILRRLLSHHLQLPAAEIPIIYGMEGRPFLEGQNLTFNLSHAGERILIGLATEGHLGVDIEEVKPLPELAAMLDMVFSEPEQHAFKCLEERHQLAFFYRGWTLKESALKAMGLGIGKALRQFSVDFVNDPCVLSVAAEVQELHQLRLFDISSDLQYQQALATTLAAPVIREYGWDHARHSTN